MSIKTYEIPFFKGLNQAGNENGMKQCFTTDAVNMDTEGGELRVAKGYERLADKPVPGDGGIDMLSCFRINGMEYPVVISGGSIYVMMGGMWLNCHSYPEGRVAAGYDSETVRIGTRDYLVIADGCGAMIKFDGVTCTPFGSEEGCSNIPVSFLTVYRGRLFAAGDGENPNRLYYSVLPGSGRTVEDWGSVEASPNVEGGHVEVGSLGGDPIVAIKALSNQLLIFKKHSLYRLIGDRPSNFTIEHIDANVLETRQKAIAVYGDVLYFVTAEGLYVYNGVTARPCPDAELIKQVMRRADTSRSAAMIVHDKLYFSYVNRDNSEDELMVYDLRQRKYLRRAGFYISDIAAIDARPIIVGRSRILYELDRGTSYDGIPIKAHWKTPYSDLGEKAAIKAPKRLFLRGEGNDVSVELEIDGKKTPYSLSLPSEGRAVVSELPLFGEGRCLSLRFSNTDGGSFRLEGGVELELGVRRRTE